MKTFILTFFIWILSPVNAQSVLTIDSAATIGVFTGADLCADIIAGNGILYGGGNICGGLVNVQQITNELPGSFELFQNYPNPFNPSTMIKYRIPENSFVSIKLYDQLGRETEVIFEGEQKAGYCEINFNGSNIASGVYFIRLTASGYVKTIKINLIK